MNRRSTIIVLTVVYCIFAVRGFAVTPAAWTAKFDGEDVGWVSATFSGLVIAATEKGLCALDDSTGAVIWSKADLRKPDKIALDVLEPPFGLLRLEKGQRGKVVRILMDLETGREIWNSADLGLLDVWHQVFVPERGLVVPVIRHADRMSFAELEQAINDFVARIKENRLTLADLEGGTFTITNGGVFGSLLSTPILNTPQSGILGMHRVDRRPVAVDELVVIRPMMYVALSYDHRIVDGREAVSFLVKVKEGIEDPERMLLEV